MNNWKYAVFIVILSLLTIGCTSHKQSPIDSLRSQGLTIATWNMEHFAYPPNKGCRPRGDKDIKAIKRYIDHVGADIYGVEEVASKEALRQVFPAKDWNIVMSTRPDSSPYECRENGFTSTQQKVALVAKKSVQIKQTQQLPALGLDTPGLRYGVMASVQTEKGAMDILVVHLKSGCFVDDYTRSDEKACQVLARQVPVLTSWIKQHEREGRPYLIMGDFNHRLSAPYNRFTRKINASRNPNSELVLATRDLIGCHPYYPAPIDHIWVGGTDTANIESATKVWPFSDMDVDNMLSDHCAVSVTLP